MHAARGTIPRIIVINNYDAFVRNQWFELFEHEHYWIVPITVDAKHSNFCARKLAG